MNSTELWKCVCYNRKYVCSKPITKYQKSRAKYVRYNCEFVIAENIITKL